MKENLIFVRPLYDPRISRIEKKLVKFCQKFLDLYASIYGTRAKVSFFSDLCFGNIFESQNVINISLSGSFKNAI